MRFPVELAPGCLLRPFSLEDAAAIFAVVDAGRAELRRSLRWVDLTTSINDTERFLVHTAAADELAAGVFVEGRVAGGCGLHRIDLANRKAEIGYWLAAPYRGRGLMLAAARAVTLYGFEDLRLHRIAILCAVENRASRAIPERLGYRLEGIARGAQRLAEGPVDQAVYARLATDPA